MARHTYTDLEILAEVPTSARESEILDILYNKEIGWNHVAALKRISSSTDEVLAEWLNISPKTLREYKKPNAVFNKNVKEHVLSLLATFKHGVAVFGSEKDFERWLNTENFFFDNRRPGHFLDTITGIKFIDDRLTAIEYGDNA